MFEVIGVLVVTAIFGYLALVCIAFNFIPAEIPWWQRVILLVLAVGFVLAWWMLVGTDITIGMK
jgi:TRAP-type uncharacterized transport system fused permease subunit